MERGDLGALIAFAAVAKEKSFTRAAIGLNLSPSAVSHSIKTLEERLGIGLLNRTTRSVAVTEAGEQLLHRLQPALGDIDTAIDELLAMRSTPSGVIRITAVKHALDKVLLPTLNEFLSDFPDITLELCADDAIADVVAAGYDAGVRLGERVDRDMVAIRISPEIFTAVVGTPEYFARHPVPTSPRDLARHQCIGHRMATGGLHPWPFVEEGRSFQVKVQGNLVFNDSNLILSAALRGQGLAYLFADEVEPYIRCGKLVSVLSESTTTFPGYYFFYPNRRRQRPALAAFINHLRKINSRDHS
ncbi:LysR family transcriptional regulator [Novosphingopyxis sp.]|uniref:LysR family transcriptional regulator n=1 Tax=Novosphingopyxis sp. TaxID=2709690 RepID=UPI003B5CAC05